MNLINPNTTEIYIQLPEDEAARPTQGRMIADNIYEVLPTPDYDPEDEDWEFVPGTIVRCDERDFRGKKYVLAIEKVG